MSQRPAHHVPLVVVGAGPAGYAAAFRAADLGVPVTLVDPEPDPGGVCLYRGCIPSKALLHVAALIEETRRAAAWGVRFGEPEVDLGKLRSWKEGVVQKLTRGLGQLRKQRKIDYLRGRACFEGGRRMRVETVSGERTILGFEHAVIATGSLPIWPSAFPPRSARLLDSTGVLDLRQVPPSVLVVGGGYIGLELGSVLASLGSRVTVVELLDGLLPGVDRDLVRPLAQKLARDFESILLKTRVARLEEDGTGVAVQLEGEDLSDPGRRFDQVLVAVGRRPCTEGLGLEATEVERTEEGFVRVDAERRTAEPTIFAVGDVAGQPMLAHKASAEGRVVAEIVAGRRAAFEPNAIPAVVFTDPEIAWCGLTEDAARAAGADIRVGHFPWAASGRAATLGRDDGLTKLVVEAGTNRILGVGITGPGAGELIAEGVLAVEMASLVSDVGASIHPHPTLSETLMEAAEVLSGGSIHLHRPTRP